MSIRGIEVYYYAVCKRKLWLFHRGIGFEEQYDRVQEGKVLHEYAYGKLEKEINIDDMAVVDAVDGEWIREVKISSKMESADRLQMLYYLYLLQQRGVEKKGLLSYPKEKKTIEVILGLDEHLEVLAALEGVQHILDGTLPRYRKVKICAKCAYRDFCESGESGDEK